VAGINLQQLMVRALLALPRPLLRVMSGGGVVYKGGRTLDARFQFLANAGKGAPPLSSLSPEDARNASAAGLAAVTGAPERALTLEDFTVPSVNGDVRVRAYRPDEQDTDAPVMVFAHMGGGVIGDLETCHTFCTLLAVIGRGPVISVDYRLSPENRYPKGLEDVLAVYRWARDNTARFDAPEGRVAIGGDSMGGNFAAVIAQEMKRTGEPQPELQLLIYPAVDVASETASMTTYADAYPLSTETMTWFMGHYMPPDANPANPRLSPVKAEDLGGLCPAIVATAGFDPLVDQGELYARRLKEAGVSVTYRCYDHLAHGFCAFTGAVPAADAASREIAAMVRKHYEGAAA
jgi:acetyl esterase/lipase